MACAISQFTPVTMADGLYFPWDADDKIARKVCKIEGVFGGGRIHCITQQVPRP